MNILTIECGAISHIPPLRQPPAQPELPPPSLRTLYPPHLLPVPTTVGSPVAEFQSDIDRFHGENALDYFERYVDHVEGTLSQRASN